MGFFDLVTDIVKLPVAIVADVVTLGGALTDREEPYTISTGSAIADDLDDLLP